jgi:hypothetical protein
VIFDDLNQIPPAIERVIIINVNTEAVSAVAIASALRNAGAPVLVINCTPPGRERDLMHMLAESWNFDLIDLSLSPHGIMLDRLFQSIYCDRLLLLDSDAELCSPLVTPRMRSDLFNTCAYGSGWIHDAGWLAPNQVGVTTPMVYRERPWIPCAMFRMSYVRSGLSVGCTFNESFVSGLGVYNLSLPAEFLPADGGYPPGVHNDTGAALHAWALDLGLHFAGPSVYTITDEVRHHHGVTRSAMTPSGGNFSIAAEAERQALERLRDAYPEYWPQFTQAVQTAMV